MSLLQAKLQVHNREARRKAHDLALVQLNKTRGCSYCWCALTSAVQCGVDTITNGATCGWDAIRECTLAQDDAEVHKADNDDLDEDDEEDENDEDGEVEHDETRQLLSQREGGRRRRRKSLVKNTKKFITQERKSMSLSELQEAEDKSDDEEDEKEEEEELFQKSDKSSRQGRDVLHKNVAKTCNVP